MLHKLDMGALACLSVTQKSNPPLTSLYIESNDDGYGVLRTVGIANYHIKCMCGDFLVLLAG